MRYFKFWACVCILMAVSMAISVTAFFNPDGWGFSFENPFFQDMPFVFNNVGVYFGITGTILWLGRLFPFSNKLMVFALAIGFISYWLQYFIDPLTGASAAQRLAMMLWAIGTISLMTFVIYISPLYKWFGYQKTEQDKQFVLGFLCLTIVNLSLGSATNDALQLSTVLLPEAIDTDLIKMDMAYHGFAGWLYSSFESTPAAWQTLVYVTYEFLSIFILLMLGLVYRERKTVSLNALRMLVVPFLLAFALYCFTPVVGPKYAFGENYPHNLEFMLSYPAGGGILISPTLRNGMPSMHFTGAMLIVLATACLSRKVWFYAACFFAVLTFIATMAIGEHYLIDLIVAMPFCIALGTALINPHGWQFYKRSVWWACALSAALWEIMLHAAATRIFLGENLWFVQFFSLVSAVLFIWGFVAFLRVVWQMPSPTETEWLASLRPIKTVAQQNLASVRWVFGLFVCSGFAGLLYEVVFAKHLGVIFGGTALAAYTVMATYMGGMALGTWLGGIVADRVRSPLKWYALFEAAIGAYALTTPTLFKWIEHIYVVLAADVRPDAPTLTLWRILLGVAVLGIPTILMGTTLPIMFKFLRGHLPGRGNIIAGLYTANIIGAAFGALAGAYIILPTFGLLSSIRLAALFSLMIALYAIDRLKALAIKKNEQILSLPEEKTGHIALPPYNAWQQRRLGLAALWLISVGGIVSLALEITNMHMLAIIAGNSVYAFGLMLGTFLLGLGIGSFAYGKLRFLTTDPIIAAIAQLGIFFTIVISAFQWDGLTAYFSFFGPMQEYQHLDFLAREIIRSGVCAIIMMPSAVFIGLGYPATMTMASDWLKNRGDATGLGIAGLCNTLGNIAGVLLAGFVFLNWWGSNRLLLILAVISLLLALYMAWAARVAWPQMFRYNSTVQRGSAAITLLAVLFALWVYPAQWNLNKIATGANVYFAPTLRGDVIDFRESVQGGLTTVNRLEEVAVDGKAHVTLTLLTNGKFQGNNANETEAQKAFAEVPLLHQPKRENALVIGYGTGNSARVLHDHDFARLDIAELSPDIVALADKHFGDINGLVAQKDNVDMYYTDGRNYLLTQSKRYDLISMELTSIWFAGAANLYNREFYQLVKTRLHDDGILQQWVQIHHMRPMDLLYLINTLHQEFRYVWLYVIGGQGILVASNADSATNLYHLDGTAVADDTMLTEKEKQLQEGALLTPEGVDYLAQTLRNPTFFVSTDNNLYLEYATPKGNAVSYNAFAINIGMLEKLQNEAEAILMGDSEGQIMPESITASH